MKRTLLVLLALLAGCRCEPEPRPVRPERDADALRTPPERAAPIAREVRIRVYDSGFEPDDAFRLSIDGTSQGETPLGGEREFVVTLAQGTHTLTLTGTGSPDGQGTYAIEADWPLRFEAGPRRKGEGLNQGVTFRWEVRVE